MFTALLDIVGIPAGLTVMLMNWREWKGDIIFVLSATLIIIRMAFYVEKAIFEARVRRWEFKQRKKSANERVSV